MQKSALYCALHFRHAPARGALLLNAAAVATLVRLSALVLALVLAAALVGAAPARAGDHDPALDPDELAFRAILSKEELREYEAAPVDRQAAWQERFWRQNDPDPTTPSNECHDEHLRRIAKCRELFGGGAPLRWDDRCEALVRYGEPLVRVVDGGEVHTQARFEPPRERWLYKEVFLYMEDRNLDGRFNFGISSQYSNIGGIDHISESDAFLRDMPNDVENPILDFEGRPEVEAPFTDFSPQKLIKMLDTGREAWVKEPRVYTTTRTGKEIPFFFDVTTFRADPEETTAANRSELIVNYLIPYESLQNDERGVWVERRTVVLDGEQVPVKNSIEAIEQGPPIGDGSGEWILNSTSLTVPPGSYQLASRVVDLISPEREMGLSRTDAEVPAYGRDSLSMSDVLFGVSIEAVSEGKKEGGASASSGAVSRADGDTGSSAAGDASVDAAAAAAAASIAAADSSLTAAISSVAADSSPAAATSSVAADSSPAAATSRVAAVQSRAPGVTRHGWHIVPMPVRRFDARTQPHLYFEVYNLTASAPGEYKYRVEYVLTRREPRGFLASIRGLFSGTITPGVAVSFEREAHVPDAENWIAIDTSELPPDTYFLETRVKDLVGGGEASRRASFVMAGESH